MEAMKLKVTIYIDVISSWCFWAQPAWEELKKAQVLRELRNKAAHETDVQTLSNNVVSNYIHACLVLGSKIRKNAA